MTLNVGDRVEVEIGPIAHGGHCVARHEGRVLFVRGVLPRERALVEVVDVGRRGRFVRAVPIEVLTASEYAQPDRPRQAIFTPSCTT